jgi:hypothetical protein
MKLIWLILGILAYIAIICVVYAIFGALIALFGLYFFLPALAIIGVTYYLDWVFFNDKINDD